MISFLFMFTVLEPVKAMAVDIPSVRLNLIMEDVNLITQCDLLDPVLTVNEKLHWVSLSIPESEIEERTTYYKACSAVSEVYTDNHSKLSLVPLDTEYNAKQWNLKFMGLESAWDITTGSSDIIVAVVDTGVDPVSSLSDFGTGTIINGVWVVVNPVTALQEVKEDTYAGQYSYDGGSHGTAVASVIAASMNSKGIVGIAPGVKIMPVKVFNDEAFPGEEVYAEDSDIAVGIIWAVDHGADIINLSLGGSENDATLAQAIAYAHNKGVIIVASSGNTSDHNGSYYGFIAHEAVKYPAAYPEVISVGSVSFGGTLSNFSDIYGSGIDLVAYGEGIWLPWNQDNVYEELSGTSFAAPSVAGILALLLSAHPELNSDEAEAILLSAARDIESISGYLYYDGYDTYTGFGIANATQTLLIADKYHQTEDVNHSIETAVDAKDGQTYTEMLNPILDKDYFCFETYRTENITITSTPTDKLDVRLNLYRLLVDGSMLLVSDWDKQLGAYTENLTLDLTASKYCVVVSDPANRSHEIGTYSITISLNNPTMPSIDLSNSKGSLADQDLSLEPVHVKLNVSYEYTLTVLRNGEEYAVPSDLIFNEDGNYTVTLDDGIHPSVTTHFSVTRFRVSGVEDGVTYNHPVTITFVADSATINGEALTGPITISADGEYHLEFFSDSKTYVIDFALDQTAPIILNVINRGKYINESPIIYFNEGTATLDGKPFYSGTKITGEGGHTLIVTDEAGNWNSVLIWIYTSVGIMTPFTSSHYDHVHFTFFEIFGTEYFRVSMTDPITGNPVDLGEFTGKTFVVEGLSPYTSYTLSIEGCFRNDGKTLCSTPKSITVTTNLQGFQLYPTVVDYKTVYADWDDVPYADGYDLYVDNVWVATVSESAGYFVVPQIYSVDGGTYTFKAISYDMVDGQKKTGPAATSDRMHLGLGVPQNINYAFHEDGSVTLTWDPVINASHYIVTYGTNYYFTDGSSVTVTDPSITLSNLPKGTLYRVVVRACLKISDTFTLRGSNSNQVSFNTVALTPVLTGESYNLNGVQLVWNRLEGVSYYELHVFNPSTGLFELCKTIESSWYWTYVNNLIDGMTYQFKVRGFSYHNGVYLYSDFSNVVSVTVQRPVVTNLAIKNVTSNSIDLEWNPITGVSGYEILTSTSINGTYSVFGYVSQPDNHQNMKYSLSNLPFNVYTYIKVRYVINDNGQNIYGPLTSAVNGKTKLDFVRGVTSETVNYNTIKVSWDPVSTASGYEVWVSSGSSYILSMVKSQTQTTFTHTGLITNTEYRYRIKPYRMVGTTKVYGEISSETSSTPYPNAPEVTATSVSYNSIKVTWTAVPGVTGYEVSYAYQGDINPQFILVGTMTSTSVTIPNLSEHKTYIILVQPYRLVGTKKVWGDVGFDIMLTVATTPTMVATSQSYNSLKLTWNAVPGALGYELFAFNPNTMVIEKLTETSGLTYIHTGLVTGEKRLYMIRSYRDAGEGRYYSYDSPFVTGTPVPSSVTGITVGNPKTTELTVSWNTTTGATGYEVSRSTSLTGTYAFVANVENGQSYVNSGLLFNTTYYYKIRPYTTVNSVRSYGSLSTAYSGKTALDTVLNPTATSTSYNTNFVQWSPITGVTTYEVYYSIGTSTTYTLLKTVTGANYSHTGLLTNTKYNYKIRATKTVSLVKYVGAFSNIVSSIPVPSAPTISAVSTGTDSIRASWPAVSGATGYEVTKSMSADFSAPIISTVTTTQYNLNGLSTNVPVYLKVRAYRLVGTVKVYSAISNTVNVKPIPNTPNLTGTVLDYQGIRLSWNTILNASGYELYKQNSENGSFELVLDNLDLSYSENGLIPGTIHRFKVKAYVLVNDVRIYSAESPMISLSPIPGPVSNFIVKTPKYTELNLSWNAVLGATGYEITRSTTATGTYVLVANVENSLIYSDSALAFNTSYFYKIRAYTTVNDVKVYGSSTVSVTGKTALETVLNPLATYTAYNSNKISWSAVNGATGYEIYRSAGTSTTYAYLTALTGTTYSNTGLYTNSKYNYKIRAYRLVGTVKVYGAFSSIVSATPLPWAPTITVSSLSNTSLKVTWPVVAGANGYEVSYSTSETGTYIKLALLTTNSASITKLLTNTTYYVKVRAYRIVNYVKIYGASSTIVTGTPIPSTPLVTAISAGFDSVKLSWAAITGATGYEVYALTPESSDYFLAADVTTLTATVERLTAGTVNSFKVRAYQIVNGTRVYSVDSAVKTSTPIPSTVTGLKVVMPSITSLKLSWTAVDGATGYELFKATSSTGTYVSLGTVEGNTEFNVTGLTFNTSTYYKVRAYTTVGATKVYGLSTAVLTGKTMPSTVQLSVSNPSYNTNALSWLAIEGATGYEIYVSTGTSTYYTLLKSLTTTSFTHATLAFNTQYNYKVRAYRLVGTVKYYGAYSTLMSIKTAVSAPSAIANSTHDSISLTWNAVTGASGYEVSIATSLTGPYTISTQTTVSKAFSGLITGATYYIKLRSYRLVSTTKVYGPYASVITLILMLETPVIQLTELTENTVTLLSTTIPGAVEYESRFFSEKEQRIVTSTSGILPEIFADFLDPTDRYTVDVRAVKIVNGKKVYSEYSTPIVFSFSDIK